MKVIIKQGQQKLATVDLERVQQKEEVVGMGSTAYRVSSVTTELFNAGNQAVYIVHV